MIKNILFVILLFPLLMSCEKLKEEDKSKIENILNQFYEKRNEIEEIKFATLAYKKIFRFSYQINSLRKGYYSENHDEIYNYLIKLKEKYGKVLKYRFEEISYPNTIYDVPEKKLYFAMVDVDYEKSKEAIELFVLKKQNDKFKIYSYSIQYK